MGFQRGLCDMMLLALSALSVHGTAPTFLETPCAADIITQPDEGRNDATVYWAVPLANVGEKAAAVTCDRNPGEKYAGGGNPVSCEAKDVDNPADSTMCTFQVRVYPTFETACPADFPFGDGNAVTFDPPVANPDADGGTRPVVTCDDPAAFPNGTTTVTCEAAGAESRNVSCSFDVTVGALPSFESNGSCGDVIINTAPDPDQSTATVTWTKPTSSAGATVTCTDPDSSPSVFSGGVTTVTCNSVDDAEPKLLVSCSFDVRVYPTFVTGCPDNIVAANGETVTFATPAVNPDSAGAEVTPACDPLSGGPFSDDQASNVTCTARDGTLTSQNATCAFTVTLGTVPPFTDEGSCASPGAVDVVPDAGKMTAEGGITGKWTIPTAAESVTCVPDPDTATFVGGATDVTCTTADAAVPTLINACTFQVRVFPQFSENSCGEDVTRSPDANDHKATYAWVNTATNKDGSVAPVICTPPSGSKFSGGQTEVTCTATQADNEESTCAFEVSVWPKLDETTSVADITQKPDAGSNEATVTWSPPTVTDGGGDDVTVQCVPEPGSTFAGGATDVACYGEDPTSKLRAVNPFTVSVWPNMLGNELVQDILRGPDQGENVASSVDWFPPTVTGSNGERVLVTCTPASGSEFNGGEHEVECVATDPVETNYQATNRFKVQVFPTFAAVCADFQIPPETDSETTVVDYATPTGAPDSLGTSAAVTCVPDTGTRFPNDEVTEVMCFAVDSDAAAFPTKAICGLKVTVGTAPAFVEGCPPDMKTGPIAGENVARGVTWTNPGATQSDGNEAAVTCLPVSGSTFSGGSTLVTCTAVDTRMPTLKTECSFTVSVFPTFESPCIDATADPTTGTTTVDYDAPVGAPDSLDTPAGVFCVPASGTDFTDNQATDVTCEATDSDNASYPVEATCTFKVLVADAPEFDAVPPCPADVATGPGESGNTAVAAWTDPTATQGDGNAPAAVACEPASGATFPAGSSPVTCTAVDPRSASLTKTCTFQVQVYPTFKSGCRDVEVDTVGTGTTTTVAYDLPVGDTDSGGTNAAAVSCVPDTGAAFENDKATGVTCTASDPTPATFPNATCTFQVKVGKAPTFNNSCPSNQVVVPVASGEAVVTWETVTGNDDSTGRPAAVVCDPENGSAFYQTETLVTCTAEDAASLRISHCTFKVILDSVAPVVLCPPAPPPVPVDAGSDQAAVTWTDPTVGLDGGDADRPVSVACVPKAGSKFLNGQTTVYCSAIDSVGNVGQCSFEVSVTGAACDPVCAGESDCVLNATGNPGCVCRDGYSSPTDNGLVCQNVNECTTGTFPCHTNADCTDSTPGFSCACKTGFFGDGIFRCDQYQTEYPDIEIPVDKVFTVELSIADWSAGATGANCDPDTDKDSPACVALVNTLKLLVTPKYSGLSNSFKGVVVDQSQIRKGSVIVPHTVSYDYSTASTATRALDADQFYADTVESSVDMGRIGSLRLVSTYKSVTETTSFCTDEVRDTMECSNRLSVYEVHTAQGCQLRCGSRCSIVTAYCNGGTCTHDNTAGETCSECPEGFEGEFCDEEALDIPLIVGLSVGLGGGALLVVICLIVYFMCFKNRETKVTVTTPGGEEVGQSNEALALEGR